MFVQSVLFLERGLPGEENLGAKGADFSRPAGAQPTEFVARYNKTGVLGNPFVFLMAGVATDYTEIGLLWTNIGRRTAIWLPIVTVPQILLLGYLLNVYVTA